MIGSIIKKIVGSKNERELKRLQPLVDKINSLEPQMKALDDAGVADTSRRLAQELVVNDKVDVLAGFGLTPLALAAAPVATEAKVPAIEGIAERM